MAGSARCSKFKDMSSSEKSNNEMMSFGLFTSSSSSSSSSSSNLSPLAPPFKVERPNNNNINKFNLGSNFDSPFNFNAKSDPVGFWSSSPNFQSSLSSQDLSADSIRTATVPVTYSTFPNPNPIAITTPSTNNWSSTAAVNLSAVGPNQHVIDASFTTFSSAFATSSGHIGGPNQRVIDAYFSSGFDAPNVHNWSSMNSSVKSGLEHVDPPAGHVFGVNANAQSHKWSLGNDGSDNGAPLMPLEYSLLPGGSFHQDYGSSQVGYSESLSGSMYSGQADGARGKEGFYSFGASTRENNIGPSIIGASHGTSSPAAGHGLVSSGFSNEHTFTWNDYAPHYSFETRSVLYDSTSDHISPAVTTKSQDISSTSPFNKNNLSVSIKPSKEKESYQAVGFERKSSLNSQLPDMNSAGDVNSVAHESEQLDHHNPGEDSPCWKGAPTHFSSSGSQEEESSPHPMKKLQNNSSSGEDVLLHMDQSLHGMVENVANAVTSESLEVNTVVKALHNLSELLLRLYSKDECRLKEQDQKALDHVIANLNVCMSGKVQQVDPAQKCSLPQQITSNEIREERNNDQYGKNIEELQSAYVRDEGLPKDYNMVQKIKRVLDEDLEFKEDLPSDPLLYKNLWLEAEAELCLSSYKGRLHRAKRDMAKAKASEKEPADVETSGNKNQSSGVAEEPHLKHLLDTDDAVVMDSRGYQKMQGPFATEDVDHAVMVRLNVLKSRGEPDPDDAQVSGSYESLCFATATSHNPRPPSPATANTKTNFITSTKLYANPPQTTAHAPAPTEIYEDRLKPGVEKNVGFYVLKEKFGQSINPREKVKIASELMKLFMENGMIGGGCSRDGWRWWSDVGGWSSEGVGNVDDAICEDVQKMGFNLGLGLILR
ncbi:hypothetical protein M8C21_027488 [Ambrosia artemisiifolia]|uniref:Uncharacterized protein n=1 Tax=Ambrosia artemisiifolia TaxID=4212 RepID=A0AAD5G1T3_AMBAR|nr:hypothetical protein M8C21_027488 [Ambrosia artemisiifolia]